jgi:hypothetical protein
MSEAEVAQAAGMELQTWRRRERTAFRARVQLINPGERQRLYDAEQVRAYLAGRPVPVQPRPEERREHAVDLLNDREAGAVLGVDASTMRAYAATGYLSGGIEDHGRRWPRHSLLARRDAGDQRHHPHLTGAGRRTGDPANRALKPRFDPRILEIADELALERSGDRKPVTPAEVAARYGVSNRAAQRLLAAARTPPSLAPAGG